MRITSFRISLFTFFSSPDRHSGQLGWYAMSAVWSSELFGSLAHTAQSDARLMLVYSKLERKNRMIIASTRARCAVEAVTYLRLHDSPHPRHYHGPRPGNRQDPKIPYDSDTNPTPLCALRYQPWQPKNPDSPRVTTIP